jgi:hypothetical protein
MAAQADPEGLDQVPSVQPYGIHMYISEAPDASRTCHGITTNTFTVVQPNLTMQISLDIFLWIGGWEFGDSGTLYDATVAHRS